MVESISMEPWQPFTTIYLYTTLRKMNGDKSQVQTVRFRAVGMRGVGEETQVESTSLGVRYLASPIIVFQIFYIYIFFWPILTIAYYVGEFSSPKQGTFYHYNDFWRLDPSSREWTRIESKSKGPPARSGHRMVYFKVSSLAEF